GGQESVRCCGCRSRLAAVIGVEPLLSCIPVENEGAAADARRLRLDEVEHHLHRYRGIQRTAALAENSDAGLRRQRMGRGDDLAFGVDGTLGFASRGSFRCRRGLRQWSIRPDEKGETCEKPQHQSDSRKESIAVTA